MTLERLRNSRHSVLINHVNPIYYPSKLHVGLFPRRCIVRDELHEAIRVAGGKKGLKRLEDLAEIFVSNDQSWLYLESCNLCYHRQSIPLHNKSYGSSNGSFISPKGSVKNHTQTSC